MHVTYVLITILISVLTVVYYFMQRRLNYWKSRNVPYEKPHPIYGNVQGFRSYRIMHDIITEFYNKNKNCGAPFAGFYLLMKPVAFVLDRKLAKNILIKDFSNFTDRGLYSNEKDDPLTGHLFNLDGAKWTQMRHKLSPTFTSGKMKFMFPTIVQVAEEFVDVMAEVIPRSNASGSGGSIIEIKDLMARFTTDVIGSCAFGIKCNSLRDPKAEFRIMGRKAFSVTRHSQFIFSLILAFPNMARKLGMRIIAEDVHQFFMRLVRETVAMRERENIVRNDFMNILIEMKKADPAKLGNGQAVSGLSLEQIAAQAFVFFLAGFETSSSTMSFALYELAQHQDIQDKAREEINRIFSKYNNSISYETIKELRYLDQILSETLRYYTLVPNLIRTALNDYVVPDNPELIIEKGISVVVPSCAYHHDADIYPEPEKFLPERFDPDQVAARDSIDWLPFGDGPRNCIGKRFGQMQSRVGLAMLLKNFKFTVCKETAIPLQYDAKSLALSSKGGIHLRAERVL